MKAKTIDNSPYGFETCIYDNEDYPMGYYVEGLPDEERADKYTNSFNSALSAHVAKETAPLLAEIDRLKKEVERLGSDKWISVGERLPDKTDRYLVMLKYPAGGLDFAICVFYNDHRQYFDHFLEDRIIHWQPLPQPK